MTISALKTFGPQDLKRLKVSDLVAFAEDVRKFLIANVSKTGGHIGANLAVIELTIAIHHVFESPRDPIIFDTGHQGYTHKLITGRQALFPTLNKYGGMSRFLARQESEHDIIDASHAGTSIAIGCGMAWSLKKDGSDRHVIAVIGDGSLVEGMAFEGLNFAAAASLRLVIILNDNGMAIAPNVGGIKNLTSGEDWKSKSRAFFEGLGLGYIAVDDGHDIAALSHAMHQARAIASPVLVHVKTEKGRGLVCATTHPYKMHFSMPFDAESGKGASPTVVGKTYAAVAAEELERLLNGDQDIIVITPATPYASYLDDLMRRYPDRVLDVGMAEQYAVGMACGLALSGKKPVVCFQTTFMQRAFDQLLHDACYMNLPITFLGVRSGFSGYDSPTHHGLYDIPYLRSFPNMQIAYPVDSRDMRNLIMERMKTPDGPMVILHPYEPIPNPEIDAGVCGSAGLAVLEEGRDGVILCLSNRLHAAVRLREMLKTKHRAEFGLVCVRSIKPFPELLILNLCRSVPRVVTMEESTLPGGFGSLVLELLMDHGVNVSVFRSGVPDRFVPPGSKEECARECRIDPDTLMRDVLKRWPELSDKNGRAAAR